MAKIQIRRGNLSEWTDANPILAVGEIGYVKDRNEFKFGDGTSTWSQLPYASNNMKVSETVPVTAVAGDLWYESDTGSTFIYYDSTWVETGS